MKFTALLFVAFAQIAAASSSSVVRGRQEQVVGRRAKEDRTSAFDTTDLNCQIGLQHDEDGSAVKGTEFEYWYAIGSNDNVTSSEVNVLESVLFYQTMATGMVWCTGEAADGVPIGRNRLLEVSRDEEKARKLFSQRARELGIIAVNAGPPDIMTDFECPDALQESMNATGSSSCIVMTGLMRIVAHQADDVSYLVASLRDSIEEAMNTTDTVPDIPNFNFVTYLGDTEAEALAYGTASTSRGGGAGIALIAGVTIPLVVGLVAAALLLQRRRGTMTDVQYRGMASSDFVLVGTGDPVGAFHEGLYHYMRDGTRYLSTRCEGCLETRKNGFYTDHNLRTITEGEQFQETGLGAKNSTIDVHKCASAICDRCTPSGSNQTSFIPAPRSPRSPTGSGGTHSLFTDIHSTESSTRTYDHIEV